LSLLDLLLAVIVGGSVVFGFLAGFARAGVSFLAAIAGVLFGFWFYGIPADFIHRYVGSQTFSNIFGFLTVFFVCVLMGALIGKLLAKLLKWTGLSWLDRLMGAGFGLVRGVIAAVAFVSILLAFTPKPVPNWMTGSMLLPYAIDASNMIATLAPRGLKNSVRETVGEVHQLWDDQVRKSQRRDPKQEKKSEPKSPPPKPLNQ
jgi:membrane protein required for colicin V production